MKKYRHISAFETDRSKRTGSRRIQLNCEQTNQKTFINVKEDDKRETWKIAEEHLLSLGFKMLACTTYKGISIILTTSKDLTL